MMQRTEADRLKKVILDSVVELLVNVGNCAQTADDRREIISLCSSCITDNVDKLALSREEAFGIIDEIATELKAAWDEMHTG